MRENCSKVKCFGFSGTNNNSPDRIIRQEEPIEGVSPYNFGTDVTLIESIFLCLQLSFLAKEHCCYTWAYREKSFQMFRYLNFREGR